MKTTILFSINIGNLYSILNLHEVREKIIKEAYYTEQITQSNAKYQISRNDIKDLAPSSK